MNEAEPKRPTLDYSQRGTRAPISQTQSEINWFLVWMMASGAIGVVIVVIVGLLRG